MHKISASLLSLALICSAVTLAWSASLGFFQKQQGIGVTPKKGKAHYNAKSGEFSVTGGGANIWAKTDAFEYVYKQISGDMTVTADVHFKGDGVEAHRKAALMFRQNLTPGSAYADVALHGDGLTSLQYRPSAGLDTKEIRSAVKAPLRIRIVRRGNQFTIAAGDPTAELQTSGPVTVTLKDPIYLGLAVCSHNAGVLETAVFSNVQLRPGAGTTTSRLRVGTPVVPERMPF